MNKIIIIFIIMHNKLFCDLTFKGMTLVSWWYNEYGSQITKTSVDNMYNIGVEWVCLIPTWYMDNGTSNIIYSDILRTPTDSNLIDIIQYIKSKGMKVFLKPHVDCKDDTWRGVIVPSSISLWFQNYISFITHYAQIAKDYNIDLFCIGTELRSLSGNNYFSFWQEVISSVKQIYSGPLTYAANWDEYKNVSFWNSLDYIGIDAYFPLSNQQNPDLATIKNGWTSYNGVFGYHNWVNEIENSLGGKQVIFTEIGYRSIDYAAKEPWSWTTSGVYNEILQLRCYEAALQVWKDRESFAGMFWWAWTCNPNAGGEGNTDYTPQNKLAENVLSIYYGSNQNIHEYNLLINVYPSNSGNVVVTPSTPVYSAGTQVTLMAQPNSGYIFDSWSGDLYTNQNPAIITMDSNKIVVARFKQNQQTAYSIYVSVSPQNSGVVFFNPPGGTYTAGTQLTLTAQPNSGYTFDSWSGDFISNQNPVTIFVNSNKSITANFIINSDTHSIYAIAIVVNPKDSGVVILNPPGGSYLVGTNITLSAYPNFGYTFSGWSGDITNKENPVAITIDNNKTIIANFSVTSYEPIETKNNIVVLHPTINPFLLNTQSYTELRYYINKPLFIKVKIYDMILNLVKESEHEYKQKGEHLYLFDGIDNNGNVLPTGIYLYQIESENEKSNFGKILLVK